MGAASLYFLLCRGALSKLLQKGALRGPEEGTGGWRVGRQEDRRKLCQCATSPHFLTFPRSSEVNLFPQTARTRIWFCSSQESKLLMLFTKILSLGQCSQNIPTGSMQSSKLNFAHFNLKINILTNIFETGKCPYVNKYTRLHQRARSCRIIWAGWLEGRQDGERALRVALIRWRTATVREAASPPALTQMLTPWSAVLRGASTALESNRA